MTGRTTREVAAVIARRESFAEALLVDERRRGHVEQHGGRWQATPALLETYAGAFAYFTGPTPKTTKGDRP